MELGRVAVVAVGSTALPVGNEATDDALGHIGLAVAELVTRGWHVVVTHGNSAYMAMATRRSGAAAAADPGVARDSLDIRTAESQGALGYRLLMAIDDALARRHRHERASVVLTRVLVSLDDPAFARAAAEVDANGGRRVVASPKPLRVLDVDPIEDLLDAGHVVIAAGGGGIPVARDAAGFHHGVEAAVDKDYTTARLAIDLDADLFVMCTDVSHIAVDYRMPSQRDLDKLDDVQAEELLRAHQLAPKTMAPKIESAIWFLRSPTRHARSAIVTTPDEIADALLGRAGTWVTASAQAAR